MSNRPEKILRGDNLTVPGVTRNAVIGALYEVLGRDDALSRCYAVKALEKMNADDEASRERLVDLLLDQDSDVRMDAVVALGRMKVEQAALPLLENLENDPEGEVRIEVVKALSRINSSQTVERLIHCFKEDGYPGLDYLVDDLEFNACWEVQSSLMDALAEIGDSRAVEPLIEVLESEGYEDLQESGFQALAKLSGGRAREFLLKQLKQGSELARRRAARALADLPELHIASDSAQAVILPEILTGLTNALVDRDPGVRINAARALAVSGNAEVVVPITQLLNDPDMEVRGEVATILAAIRGRDIVDRLHQLLIEDNRDLRKRIVRVLGEISEPFSLKPVSFFLDDSDKDLVYEVVVALANIGIAGSEQKLADLLADETNHYTLRIQAARALGGQSGNLPKQKHTEDKMMQGSTPKPDPGEVLEQTVFDQDERVASAALEALVEMEPDNAAVQLVKVLDFLPLPVEQKSEHELETGPPQDTVADGADEEIAAGLAEMVAGHDAQTSTLAAILVNQSRREDISTAENEDKVAYKQAQPGVRILAARLLGNFPEPGAEVIKSLALVSKEQDPELRRVAIHSLGCAGDESALGTILDGLSAEQQGVRLAALDALGNFTGSDSVRTRLIKMLEDPDPTIRQRVVEQITSLSGPEVTDYLCRALEDEDLGVCRTALDVLSRENYSTETARRVEDLMFRFSSELRKNAAATLRRMQDFSSSSRLLENLMDVEQTPQHWVCIDALAEMYSSTQNSQEKQ